LKKEEWRIGGLEDWGDNLETPSGHPAKLPTILVRGSGDVGSAVAHCFFRAGYSVTLLDNPQPTTTRRKMAFTNAIFDGCASLEGVTARRVDNLAFLAEFLTLREAIPVVIGELPALLEILEPTVLIDARMRKHHQPEVQRGLASLTIGLGPNFIAGQTTDLAVETSWGDALGQVYYQGATKPLAGEPRPIAGHGRDRYVYAPVAGMFRTSFEIGDLVNAGEIMAQIGTTPLTAPLTGAIRGLTHDGVPVTAKTKIIEIDPRGPAAVVAGIGERPRRIAIGVLVAVQAWAKDRE
jgi:xanthine dehydrogenase accessory factor